MSRQHEGDSTREPLDFDRVVKEQFSFLSNFGFVVVDATPTLVRFIGPALELNVYHGRQSYEIGLEIGREEQMFSLAELIRASDAVVARQYRKFATSNAAGVIAGVKQLAELTLRYGERALRDDPRFFELLERNRQTASKEYELEVRAQQTRLKANAAFKQRRYAEAAELYESILETLSESERKKLKIARDRS